MRYTQDQNFLIRGPGLPEQGVVAVGPAELEAAHLAGADEMRRGIIDRLWEWSGKKWGGNCRGEYNCMGDIEKWLNDPAFFVEEITTK